MAAFEGRALKGRFAFLNPQNVSQLAPVFLSIVAFAAGSMLVISGAMPAFKMRIALLQTIVPLWVLETRSCSVRCSAGCCCSSRAA